MWIGIAAARTSSAESLLLIGNWGRRDLEPSFKSLQGPVVDGDAGAEGADAGRGKIENVDNHDSPHDAEERYHYVYLLAGETQLKAEGGHAQQGHSEQ